MDTTSMQTIEPWIPTAAEVAAIVAEMRPVIDRFADRDRRLLAQLTTAA
jgi:hypothetical protein